MYWKNKEYTEVYNDYYPLISSIAYSKMGNFDEASDITQEVFIALYEKFEEVENIRNWLYGTLRFKIINHYKKNKMRENVNIDDIDDVDAIAFINGFKDLRIILQEILESDEIFEEEKDRILFELIATHYYTYEEAAKQLDLTPRQVRYKYGILVKRILECFKKKGINNVEDLL